MLERPPASPALEEVEEEETEPAANLRFLEPRPPGGSFSGGSLRGKEEEKKREC